MRGSLSLGEMTGRPSSGRWEGTCGHGGDGRKANSQQVKRAGVGKMRSFSDDDADDESDKDFSGRIRLNRPSAFVKGGMLNEGFSDDSDDEVAVRSKYGPRGTGCYVSVNTRGGGQGDSRNDRRRFSSRSPPPKQAMSEDMKNGRRRAAYDESDDSRDDLYTNNRATVTRGGGGGAGRDCHSGDVEEHDSIGKGGKKREVLDRVKNKGFSGKNVRRSKSWSSSRSRSKEDDESDGRNPRIRHREARGVKSSPSEYERNRRTDGYRNDKAKGAYDGVSGEDYVGGDRDGSECRKEPANRSRYQSHPSPESPDRQRVSKGDDSFGRSNMCVRNAGGRNNSGRSLSGSRSPPPLKSSEPLSSNISSRYVTTSSRHQRSELSSRLSPDGDQTGGKYRGDVGSVLADEYEHGDGHMPDYDDKQRDRYDRSPCNYPDHRPSSIVRERTSDHAPRTPFEGRENQRQSSSYTSPSPPRYTQLSSADDQHLASTQTDHRQKESYIHISSRSSRDSSNDDGRQSGINDDDSGSYNSSSSHRDSATGDYNGGQWEGEWKRPQQNQHDQPLCSWSGGDAGRSSGSMRHSGDDAGDTSGSLRYSGGFNSPGSGRGYHHHPAPYPPSRWPGGGGNNYSYGVAGGHGPSDGSGIMRGGGGRYGGGQGGMAGDNNSMIIRRSSRSPPPPPHMNVPPSYRYRGERGGAFIPLYSNNSMRFKNDKPDPAYHGGDGGYAKMYDERDRYGTAQNLNHSNNKWVRQGGGVARTFEERERERERDRLNKGREHDSRSRSVSPQHSSRIPRYDRRRQADGVAGDDRHHNDARRESSDNRAIMGRHGSVSTTSRSCSRERVGCSKTPLKSSASSRGRARKHNSSVPDGECPTQIGRGEAAADARGRGREGINDDKRREGPSAQRREERWARKKTGGRDLHDDYDKNQYYTLSGEMDPERRRKRQLEVEERRREDAKKKKSTGWDKAVDEETVKERFPALFNPKSLSSIKEANKSSEEESSSALPRSRASTATSNEPLAKKRPLSAQSASATHSTAKSSTKPSTTQTLPSSGRGDDADHDDDADHGDQGDHGDGGDDGDSNGDGLRSSRPSDKANAASAAPHSADPANGSSIGQLSDSTKSAIVAAATGISNKLTSSPSSLDQQRKYIQAQLCRIYIGSLDYSLSERDIRQIFSAFGEISAVDMPREASANRSKGFCFVEFSTKEAAELALVSMQGFNLKGRIIKVGRPTVSGGLTLPSLTPTTPVGVGGSMVDPNASGPLELHQQLKIQLQQMQKMQELRDQQNQVPNASAFPQSTLLMAQQAAVSAAAALNTNSTLSADAAGGNLLASTLLPHKLDNLSLANGAMAAASLLHNRSGISVNTANLIGTSSSSSTSSAPSSTLIILSSLPADFKIEDIKNVFQSFGRVKSCVCGSELGLSATTALLEFTTVEEAKMAIAAMDGFEINETKIKVTISTTGIMRLYQTIKAKKSQQSALVAPASNASQLDDAASSILQAASGGAGGEGVGGGGSAILLSSVVLMENMVDADEADEELRQEVEEECGRYGSVEHVEIAITESKKNEVRIFVKFSRRSEAAVAIKTLNGRFFGGRKLRCYFYDENLFAEKNLQEEAMTAAKITTSNSSSSISSPSLPQSTTTQGASEKPSTVSPTQSPEKEEEDRISMKKGSDGFAGHDGSSKTTRGSSEQGPMKNRQEKRDHMSKEDSKSCANDVNGHKVKKGDGASIEDGPKVSDEKSKRGAVGDTDGDDVGSAIGDTASGAVGNAVSNAVSGNVGSATSSVVGSREDEDLAGGDDARDGISEGKGSNTGELEETNDGKIGDAQPDGHEKVET